MMGERDSQKQLWSYQVNLDKRVRDRPLRRINQALDLDFVRTEAARFAKNGLFQDLKSNGSFCLSDSDRLGRDVRCRLPQS